MADQKIGKELTDKIKKSQRAWIILRDSNCEIESHEIETGTSAYEVTKIIVFPEKAHNEQNT